jgi:hypothetical protein
MVTSFILNRCESLGATIALNNLRPVGLSGSVSHLPTDLQRQLRDVRHRIVSPTGLGLILEGDKMNTTTDHVTTNEELCTAVLREIKWRPDIHSQDLQT